MNPQVRCKACVMVSYGQPESAHVDGCPYAPTNPAAPEPVEREQETQAYRDRKMDEIVAHCEALANAEPVECCPDCQRPNCRRDAVQVYKSVERIACYEHTIIRLRSELASLRALSAHNEEAARLLRVEECPGKDTVMSLADYHRRVSSWRAADRAKYSSPVAEPSSGAKACT